MEKIYLKVWKSTFGRPNAAKSRMSKSIHFFPCLLVVPFFFLIADLFCFLLHNSHFTLVFHFSFEFEQRDKSNKVKQKNSNNNNNNDIWKQNENYSIACRTSIWREYMYIYIFRIVNSVNVHFAHVYFVHDKTNSLFGFFIPHCVAFFPS